MARHMHKPNIPPGEEEMLDDRVQGMDTVGIRIQKEIEMMRQREMKALRMRR